MKTNTTRNNAIETMIRNLTPAQRTKLSEILKATGEDRAKAILTTAPEDVPELTAILLELTA